VVNLLEQKADVAIRMGNLPDSAMIARKLAQPRRVVGAAPSYLKRKGTPMTPQDLPHHNCVTFNFRRLRLGWPFRHKGRTIEQPVGANLQVNNGETMRQVALAGVGVARLGLFHVKDAINAGQLVPLLEKYNPGDLEMIHAIYLGGGNVPGRVRMFIDHMVETIARSPRSRAHSRSRFMNYYHPGAQKVDARQAFRHTSKIAGALIAGFMRSLKVDVVELVHATRPFYASIFNSIGSITDVFRKSNILFGQQDRHPLLLEFDDGVSQLLHDQGCDPLRGFIEKNEERIAHQGARHREHLLFTAAELVTEMVAALLERRKQRKQPRCSEQRCWRAVGKSARRLATGVEIFQDCQIGEDAAILRRETDPQAGDPIGGESGNVGIMQPYHPLAAFREPHNGLQGGGLASTVATHQGHDLACMHLERQIEQNLRRPVPGLQCAHLQHGAHQLVAVRASILPVPK
jgi:hypothetical protein